MTMPRAPVVITVTNVPIRLGQFLKLANVVQDGLEAKLLIQQGEVKVNGVFEIRRGRKLTHGDEVSTQGGLYLIQCAPEKNESDQKSQK